MEMEMKKLGFGIMRLPVLDQEGPAVVDLEQVCQMADTFMERGFTYFDTVYMYHKYESERMVKRAFAERWPRERYVLADKLPPSHLEEEADVGCFFREQLEKYGVVYFDYYMPHNMSRLYCETAERLGAFKFACRKKEGGKVRRIGFFFHVDAGPLEEILEKHLEVDFVQLQLNYINWDSPNIQSRQCCEVYRRYGEDVIVMEPVKGRTLAHVPREARDLMGAHAPGMTPAPWTAHFAASREGVIMVLSGMSDYIQPLDNTAYMQDFVPLTEEEEGIVGRATEIIQSVTTIFCTPCRYCVERCSKQIPVPKYSSLYNQYSLFGEKSNSKGYYQDYAGRYRKTGDCTDRRRREAICPQYLPVVQHMKEIAGVFEPAKQGAGIGKNSDNQRKWCGIPCNLSTPMLYCKTVAVDVYDKEE